MVTKVGLFSKTKYVQARKMLSVWNPFHGLNFKVMFIFLTNRQQELTVLIKIFIAFRSIYLTAFVVVRQNENNNILILLLSINIFVSMIHLILGSSGKSQKILLERLGCARFLQDFVFSLPHSSSNDCARRKAREISKPYDNLTLPCLSNIV